MYKPLLLVGLTALLSGPVVVADSKDRDRLTALLEEVDTKENIDHLTKTMGLADPSSLLQDWWWYYRYYYWWWGWWWVPYESPRRRGGHTACECPDNPGDSLTKDCLNRRITFLRDAYTGATTPDSTGMSIEGGRAALRTAYRGLTTVYADERTQMQNVTTAMLDRATGHQPKIDRASQRMLNEETLMAKSVNSAWMNLINITLLTNQGGSDITAQMNNATTQVNAWFTKLQKSEDNTTYSNLVRSALFAVGGLTDGVSRINAVESRLWSMLNGLDNNMGGTESTSTQLADSLHDAASSLSDNIAGFNSTIADAGAASANKLSDYLTGLIQGYQNAVQAALTALNTAMNSKQNVAVQASQRQIAGQATTGSDLLSQQRTAMAAAVDAVGVSQAQFVDSSDANFTAVDTALQSAFDAESLSESTRVSADRNNMTIASSQNDNVASDLSSWANDERRAIAASTTAASSQKTAAQAALTASTAGIAGKQSDILVAAHQLSAGAVEAVGTGFESNMDQVGTQYDSLLGQTASDAHAAATASSDATAGLNTAATTGNGAIVVAGQTVVSNLQTAFNGVLNSLGALPAGITTSSAARLDVSAVMNAAATNRSAAADMIRTAMLGGRNQTLTEQAATEGAISNLLDQLASAEPAAGRAVRTIGAAISAGSASGQSTSGTVDATAQANNNAVMGAANQVADAEDSFADAMSDMFNGMVTNRTVAGGAVSGAPGAAADAVAAGQAALDASIANAQRLGADAIDSITAAAVSVNVAGNSVNTSFGAANASLGLGVASGLADIDQFLSQASSGAGAAVAAQLRSIASTRATAALKVGRIDTDQMEQLRAVAASVDALMSQINKFLSSKSKPLFDQIQTLPVMAQQLFMRLKALSDQGDRVQATADAEGNSTRGSVIRSLLSALRTSNGTALGQLGQVGSDFNASAASYSATVLGTVNDIVTKFLNAASEMRTTLTGVDNTTTDVESNLGASPEDVALLAQLQAMHAAVARMSDNATDAVANGTNVSLPSNMSSLYAIVSNATSAAGADAAFASAQLAALAATSAASVDNATSFANTDGKVNPGEVDKEATVAQLNEGVANARLLARQKAIDQLKNDSTSAISDFASEVRAATASKMNSATTVYDMVVKAKADAAAMMGRIAQSFSANQTGVAADTQVSSTQLQIQLATVKQQMSVLMQVFDRYISSVKGNFDTADSSRDSYVQTLLMQVSQAMEAIDKQLLQSDTDIVNHLSTVASDMNSLEDADIDNQVGQLDLQIRGWATSEQAAIWSETAEVSSLQDTVALNSTDVEAEMNKAVSTIANAAKTLLSKYQANTTRIDEIIAQTAAAA